MQVTLVPTEHVMQMWPTVRPFISRSVERTSGKYEVEDVLELLASGDCLLWVAFEGVEVKGAVVTHFAQYPRKRYLFLDFCGGIDGFQWKDTMLSTLRNWALDNHCSGIEATGRDGWERIFSRDGYTSKLRNFELPLNYGG